MWFNGTRKPNTLYVASVSRGKDSTAMLRAIQLLGFPLDMICSVDVWFDDETPAELPEMVKFKDEWDEKCLKNFGVPVTRLCAETTEDKKHQPFLNPPVSSGGDINTLTQTAFTAPYRQSETITEALQQSKDLGVKDSSTTTQVSEKKTYCDIFYREVTKKKLQKIKEKNPQAKEIIALGYPLQKGSWCKDLKTKPFQVSPLERRARR